MNILNCSNVEDILLISLKLCLFNELMVCNLFLCIILIEVNCHGKSNE
jgi:hypothetical protein